MTEDGAEAAAVVGGVRLRPRRGPFPGSALAACMPGFRRDGGTDACPQCQGSLAFLSLTAPPTASSYIIPSPSPGPLPAFIGLFLSFSTLAFSPQGLLLSPRRRPSLIHSIFFFIPMWRLLV